MDKGSLIVAVQLVVVLAFLLSVSAASYYAWTLAGMEVGPLNILALPVGLALSLMGLAGIAWVYTVFPPRILASSTLHTVRWLYSKVRGMEAPRGGTVDLVDYGPYACVRHPLYSSTILFFLGLGLATGFLLLAVPILYLAYYIASIIEEAEMVEVHGDRYRGYQERVPRLGPHSMLTCIARLIYSRVADRGGYHHPRGVDQEG